MTFSFCAPREKKPVFYDFVLALIHMIKMLLPLFWFSFSLALFIWRFFTGFTVLIGFEVFFFFLKLNLDSVRNLNILKPKDRKVDTGLSGTRLQTSDMRRWVEDMHRRYWDRLTMQNEYGTGMETGSDWSWGFNKSQYPLLMCFVTMHPIELVPLLAPDLWVQSN